MQRAEPKMLLLTFRIHEALYAVDASQVVEVIPRVEPRPVPHAPDYFAGVFNYRGAIVPAVDLGLLLGATPCRSRLSTRIILAGDSTVTGTLVGLIAESVSDVRTLANNSAAFPPLHLRQAPYLGPVVQLNDELIQLIAINELLPDSLRLALSVQEESVR
jgi:chemotaxis-related protein WspB